MSEQPEPKFAVEIITTVKPTEIRSEKADGWGAKAVSTTLIGARPVDIRIARNEDGKLESEIGFHITDIGEVIITQYGNSYKTYVPPQLRMEPTRPW